MQPPHLHLSFRRSSQRPRNQRRIDQGFHLLKAEAMAETEYVLSVGEVEGGIWLRRESKGSPAGRLPVVRTDDKENMPPWGSGRRRRSPLPPWYPRIPLKDITAIIIALRRRRMRMCSAAAQQRSLVIGTESSPQLLFSVSRLPLDTSASGQSVSRLPLDTSASGHTLSIHDPTSDDSETATNPTVPVITTPPPTEELQISSSPPFENSLQASSIASSSPTDHSQQTTSTSINEPIKDLKPVDDEKKLWSSLNEIEKAVKENMKRKHKEPARKITQRRTLMSMR